jgi:hypothetical protein
MIGPSGNVQIYLACVPACKFGSDAYLMTVSFTSRRSIVPEEDPAWHARTFAF